MAVKKFTVDVSRDTGVTWDKTTATGWPLLPEHMGEDIQGWTISIDDGDSMFDIIITEESLEGMLKQLAKKKRQRAKG